MAVIAVLVNVYVKEVSDIEIEVKEKGLLEIDRVVSVTELKFVQDPLGVAAITNPTEEA